MKSLHMIGPKRNRKAGPTPLLHIAIGNSLSGCSFCGAGTQYYRYTPSIHTTGFLDASWTFDGEPSDYCHEPGYEEARGLCDMCEALRIMLLHRHSYSESLRLSKPLLKRVRDE
ncbi:hypothetical protein BT63DRAFT_454841 [Microthyrium microscopicum]|uniref:Uncharacterized protein n=1 Tax=Microthyrium microscopicum TaxID=703497 RepID=A0A6A6UIE8_9PEZI|nr:hypothetical protein BT63DRAFT_454841 [Microthyrium microscopicum]